MATRPRAAGILPHEVPGQLPATPRVVLWHRKAVGAPVGRWQLSEISFLPGSPVWLRLGQSIRAIGNDFGHGITESLPYVIQWFCAALILGRVMQKSGYRLIFIAAVFDDQSRHLFGSLGCRHLGARA